MSHIPGTQGIAEVKSGSADEQVGKRDDAADLPAVGIDFRRGLGHTLRERLHRNRRKNRLEILSPLVGQLRCIGPIRPCSISMTVMQESKISVCP